MNIERLYSAPTFIARGIDISIGGIGAHDEYWKGVHPSNIHREGYRPLDRRYTGTPLILKGRTPPQHSSREV